LRVPASRRSPAVAKASGLVQSAKRAGYEWVFVDTPPNVSAIVTDAISVATLIIIPPRLTLFDLAAST
jgi:cellulose biosynthesis protein BcsQ